MLMGRVTYEHLAEISASDEHEDVNRMAELPKVVFVARPAPPYLLDAIVGGRCCLARRRCCGGGNAACSGCWAGRSHPSVPVWACVDCGRWREWRRTASMRTARPWSGRTGSSPGAAGRACPTPRHAGHRGLHRAAPRTQSAGEPCRLARMSLPAFRMPRPPRRAPTGRWRHGRGGVTRLARGRRFMDPSTRTST
jgi:hypothetical protein